MVVVMRPGNHGGLALGEPSGDRVLEPATAAAGRGYDAGMVRPSLGSVGVPPYLPGRRDPGGLRTAGEEVYARARSLLCDQEDMPERPSAELRLLDAQLAVVTGLARDRLASAEGLSAQEVVTLSELLSDVQTLRFSINDLLGFQRLHRLEALDRGLSSLWRIGDQDELLRAVCATAVECCGFDRVMLSRVEDGVWRPWRSVARDQREVEQRVAAWMRQWPEIPLDRQVLESELVRRRQPAIVTDAATDPRVHPPLLEAAALASYVVAPILTGDRVVGLLHADYQDDAVTELDRDVLWAFAQGVGRAHERAMLLGRLREQGAQLLEALRVVERNLEALAVAETGLGERPRLEPLADEPPAVPRPPAIDAVLTSREMEVLALMATGATNDRIARKLVISPETVKTHVKRVLRKLQADNRAEAISLYLRLSVGSDERGLR
jgi:DNA-binding CsgD family transcriptional regulator